MKIFSVLAEFVLWELSIVSSLSLYSILVQHACNDRAWLTSECYCRLIYMLSILCVRLTIKVKVAIPVSFKVGWYPQIKTGSSHLKQMSEFLGDARYTKSIYALLSRFIV